MSVLFAFGLDEPLIVYVPVLKAQVSVVSNQLDELSRFSQFILYAIGIGEDYNEVMRVTRLDSSVIEEEIRYLMKIGLLTQEHDLDTTSLTDHGQDLYEVMVKIYEFNGYEEKVLINCLTGDFEKLNEYELMDISDRHPNFVTLKEKIVRELYQNQDPFNSREFVFEQYDFDDLDKEQKEDIHVEIRYHHDIFYLIRRIRRVPIPDHEDAFFHMKPDIEFYESNKPNAQTYLFVEWNLYKLDLELSHDSLFNYRTVLSTLKNLYGFDSDLISQKAASLLELEKREQELNQQDHSFYYDPVTGYCYIDLPNYPFVTNKTNTIDIKLPEEQKWSQVSGRDIFHAMIRIGHEEQLNSPKREKSTRNQHIFRNFNTVFGKAHNNEKKKEEHTEKDLIAEVKVLERHKVVQKVPASFFF